MLKESPASVAAKTGLAYKAKLSAMATFFEQADADHGQADGHIQRRQAALKSRAGLVAHELNAEVQRRRQQCRRRHRDHPRRRNRQHVLSAHQFPLAVLAP